MGAQHGSQWAASRGTAGRWAAAGWHVAGRLWALAVRRALPVLVEVQVYAAVPQHLVGCVRPAAAGARRVGRRAWG